MFTGHGSFPTQRISIISARARACDFCRNHRMEGSISGVILINKSRFIVAYSYAQRGAPGIRGRTGSRYVESETVRGQKVSH